jgi:predicted ATPase with chaperone activity
MMGRKLSEVNHKHQFQIQYTKASSTDVPVEKLLMAVVQQLHLSAREYHRVLKLARAIADLVGSEMIAANHVAEAV